jgi:hypothetical protein
MKEIRECSVEASQEDWDRKSENLMHLIGRMAKKKKKNCTNIYKREVAHELLLVPKN